MARSKLINTVEDTTQTAARKASEAFIEAAEKLAPLIDQAGDYLGPFTKEARKLSAKVASDAYDRVQPALRDAGIRGARLASEAYTRVQPVIDTALHAVPPVVDHAVGVVRPAVDDVLERIPPLVEVARGKVQDDVMPKVAAVLKDAASQPLAAEAAAQLALATAAVSKELRKSQRRKRNWPGVLGKIVLAGAIFAGVAVAVRKLLTPPSSSGWHAHSPSDAYVANPVADAAEDLTENAEDLAKATQKKAEDIAQDVREKAADVSETLEEKAEEAVTLAQDAAEKASDKVAEVKGEAADAVSDAAEDFAEDKPEGGDASPLAGSPYGEGSFVGSDAPQGYVIKANGRTRKYRTPASSGYERATADVWFDTVEHAEAAGFSQAQR